MLLRLYLLVRHCKLALQMNITLIVCGCYRVAITGYSKRHYARIFMETFPFLEVHPKKLLLELLPLDSVFLRLGIGFEHLRLTIYTQATLNSYGI